MIGPSWEGFGGGRLIGREAGTIDGGVQTMGVGTCRGMGALIGRAMAMHALVDRMHGSIERERWSLL